MGALATALPLRAEPASVVPITGPSQELDTEIDVIEDPMHAYDLPALTQFPASQWSRPRSLPFRPGFSKSVWWMRLQLRNDDQQHGLQRLLELRSPRQDLVEAALVRADGSVHRFTPTGDRLPFAQRTFGYRHPIFPLELAPNETVAVYLRMDTHDGLHEPMPLMLWTQEALVEHLATETLVYGLYFGAFLALILYNMFLFVSTRTKSLGVYVLYLCAMLMWSLTFNGFSFQHLWPRWPAFNNQVLALAAAASFASGAWFAMNYLPMRQLALRWHQALQALAFANVLAAVPAAFGFYILAFLLIVPCGSLTVLACLMGGLRLLRLGNRAARYFIASWFAIGIGVIMICLALFNLLPRTMGTDPIFLIQFGSVIEVLVLAFGLADSLNQSKAQALQAEREARLTQQTLAQKLEQQVQARTRELERANALLSELAVTDPLTGAFNRRHFDTVLNDKVRLLRHARMGMAALCLVDVDNFKAYNDLYGHQRGDEALKAIAATLQQHLRRGGDQLHRVGGEEFAFLLGPDDHNAALAHVDAMRRAVVALAIPHSGTAAGVVSASFGLALWTPGNQELEPGDIYKAADQLLYRAKAAGRNRVIREQIG